MATHPENIGRKQLTAEARLFRAVAPHFVAGILVTGDRCVSAAPILKWTLGKRIWEIEAYCFSKGWHLQDITLDIVTISE